MLLAKSVGPNITCGSAVRWGGATKPKNPHSHLEFDTFPCPPGVETGVETEEMLRDAKDIMKNGTAVLAYKTVEDVEATPNQPSALASVDHFQHLSISYCRKSFSMTSPQTPACPYTTTSRILAAWQCVLLTHQHPSGVATLTLRAFEKSSRPEQSHLICKHWPEHPCPPDETCHVTSASIPTRHERPRCFSIEWPGQSIHAHIDENVHVNRASGGQSIHALAIRTSMLRAHEHSCPQDTNVHATGAS